MPKKNPSGKVGNPKGNPQNLVSFRDMPKERAREIQSMGGKASAGVAVRRRTFAQALKAMLNQPLPEGIAGDAVRAIIDDGAPPSVLDAVVASLVQRGIEGDKQAVEACKLMLAQIGEDTPEKQEIRVVAGDTEVDEYMS